jgi:hypothetical protein
VLDADGTVLAGAWTRFETFMRERGLTEADLDGLLIENEAGSVRVRRYRAGR